MIQMPLRLWKGVTATLSGRYGKGIRWKGFFRKLSDCGAYRERCAKIQSGWSKTAGHYDEIWRIVT
jgi:hypothetical protein